MNATDRPSPPATGAAGGALQPLPPRPPVRLHVVLWVLLVLALLLAAAAPIGLLLALRSEPGSAWLLERLPGLAISGPRGALLGDFSAQRVELRLPGPGDQLVLDEVSWQGLQLAWSADPGTWASLQMRSLRARRATLTLAARPPSSDPTVPPSSLRLPLALHIDALQLGEFHTAALGPRPLRELSARLQLGAEAGASHRIEALQFGWDRLRATGSLQIATDAPLDLQARLQLQPQPIVERAAAAAPRTALDDWQAELRLAGPLARPALHAGITSRRLNGADPLLEADAVVQPFAAWPLAELQARLQGLDLAALDSTAPRTRLSGSARIRASALNQAAQAEVLLDNAEAGLWNEGRLPLRSLRMDLQARPDAPQVASLKQFEAELGSAQRPAGRISGTGSYDQGRWSLDTVLDQLLPQGLDARAAAMSLSGPLTLSGSVPTPARSGVTAGGATPPTVDPPPGTTLLSAKGRLSGRVEALQPARPAPRAGPRSAARVVPPQQVRIGFDADARLGPDGAVQVELRQAEAGIGAARASLQGKLQRERSGAPWQLLGQGELAAFDPRPWWPGARDSAWQRGPHRIDASGRVDLRYSAIDPPTTDRPAGAGNGASAAAATLNRALAQLRGQADLVLRPSLLAGVALEGTASLKSGGASPGPGEAEAVVALQAAGNRLKIEGRSRADRPAADQWRFDIDAPALDRLAPAAEALGLIAAARPGTGSGKPASAPKAAGTTGATGTPPLPSRSLGGRLTAQGRVDGRWPALRSEGQLDAERLRIADLGLQRGQLRWQLGSSADAPAQVDGQLTRLVIGQASADLVKLSLQGTARAHRLTFSADSSALPPAWLDALGAARPATLPAAAAASAAANGQAAPTRATLTASGGLHFASAPAAGASGPAPWAASGWRGQVQALDLRSGQAADRSLALSSRNIDVELRWEAGQPLSLTLQPGRMLVRAGPTEAALRWSQLAWQGALPAAAGRPARAARIDAAAELEPIAVAPLLVRLQPDFGWAGDLQVGGKLEIRSTPGLRADVVIERQRGDLSVTDENGTQALGLTDLRLALNAEDGVWSFTQALAGSTIGVAAGAVVARTGSDQVWPDARTPLQGVVELQVANLGTWGPWVPAGWRLGGALRTSATIGGRLGAPEYTGAVRGSGLSVRNFAEGVNISDGEVSIALQGETARIETFSARAGNGSVQLTGGASFGSAPKASLTLTADKFRLLGRVDRRIVASGQGQLLLEADKIALDGKFRVDEGLVDFTRGDAPGLSDDVVVIRSARAPAATPALTAAPAPATPARAAASAASPQALASKTPASRASAERAVEKAAEPAAAKAPGKAQRAVALNLRVDLGEQLRLRGRGLDTGLRGELRITSPGGRLAINGTVSTHGGTYAAYGQKLTIDRGSVIFSGAADNPRLDIEATRPNTDVRVGVSVTGSAVNPRIRLFSEPELPEVDKLSWLVLGRATEGLGRTDTALLQRAALALLAGEGEGLTDQLTRAIGLDELSVRQTDGEVRDTVVSLGKQLSRRWYVGYERGLNATTGTWQLIYRIAQRFTLRAQSGTENSIDLIWTWRWQ